MVGDFETTVYKGQTHTEVWASALVELYSEDVIIHHSIDECFEYIISLNEDIMLYYHNLKFDGEFWLYFLLTKTDMKPAVCKQKNGMIQEFCTQRDMPNNSYKYIISDLGQWYEITLKVNDHYIVLRDSLKLLPFSVRVIGDSFETKHRKLEMEYTGYRYAGCEITAEEKQYIANDVLVVKEALEIMFKEGYNKMTIGACCLAEFKTQFEFGNVYDNLFPDLSKIKLDEQVFGSKNADEYVRKSYQGGWCYVVKGKENKLYKDGLTADVNSLYPSMMYGDHEYPVGLPKFWKGDIPFDKWKNFKDQPYYFVRIRCRFYLKKDKLPFIHIRGNTNYRATDNLATSDVLDKKTGLYNRFWFDRQGQIHDSVVELTLTCKDWELFKEHYVIKDLEILDGCWFGVVSHIFDLYIATHMKAKIEAPNKAIRTQHKLLLNNLYGKMSSSSASNFRVAETDEDGNLHFYTVEANDKKIGYIPIGSAITSYARNFTIRASQLNYYGVNKRGFIYADTDSIHCDLKPEELRGLEIHPDNLSCWKLESYWDEAVFVRQKTYIEHVTHEDGIPVEKLKKPKQPYYNVKCAGMPQKCKDLFIKSFEDLSEEDVKEYSEEEQEFLLQRKSIMDFKKGLKVPSKLLPKHIEGGLILVETTYELR